MPAMPALAKKARVKGIRPAIGTVLTPVLMPGTRPMRALMPARIPLRKWVLETLAKGLGTLGIATPCATTAGEERRERSSEVEVPSLF